MWWRGTVMTRIILNCCMSLDPKLVTIVTDFWLPICKEGHKLKLICESCAHKCRNVWRSEEMRNTLVRKNRRVRVLGMRLRPTMSEEIKTHSTHMCRNEQNNVFCMLQRWNMGGGEEMSEENPPEIHLLCFLFTQIRRYMCTGEIITNTVVHTVRL